MAFWANARDQLGFIPTWTGRVSVIKHNNLGLRIVSLLVVYFRNLSCPVWRLGSRTLGERHNRALMVHKIMVIEVSWRKNIGSCSGVALDFC